jgi:hypothetical protein
MTKSTKVNIANWAMSSAHLGRHLSQAEWVKVESGESLEDSPKLAAVRAALLREKPATEKIEQSTKM